MRIFSKLVCSAVLSIGLSSPSAFAEDIKVGIIAPFSGQYAIWGKQIRNAIEAYQALHGDSVNGNKVVFIYKDTGGVNPGVAKAAAQELIVREKVSYLGGFVFTPNTLAVAPIVTQAKVPAVIFNAGTSMINKQSEYFLRTSYTQWQVMVPFAKWVRANGAKKIILAVADYNPGYDAEKAFGDTFKAAGGEIVDTIRMPLATTDFAPFIQRIKDSGADGLFTFLPAGPPTYAFVKAYNDAGLKRAGIAYYSTAETDEATLDALGDQAIDLITAFHYSAAHDSPENTAMIKKLKEIDQHRPNFASAGTFDGVHLIYEMIRAAGKDGTKALAAAKGMSWTSPRGPVVMDPKTRHLTQNVYLRKVQRDSGGLLQNVEFDVIKSVPDLGFDQ